MGFGKSKSARVRKYLNIFGVRALFLLCNFLVIKNTHNMYMVHKRRVLYIAFTVTDYKPLEVYGNNEYKLEP